jgi:hypothetical protein
LEEREHRRREWGGDAGHLDPHEAVADPGYRTIRDPIHDAEPRPEVARVQLPGGARLAVTPEIHKLLPPSVTEPAMAPLPICPATTDAAVHQPITVHAKIDPKRCPIRVALSTRLTVVDRSKACLQVDSNRIMSSKDRAARA